MLVHRLKFYANATYLLCQLEQILEKKFTKDQSKKFDFEKKIFCMQQNYQDPIGYWAMLFTSVSDSPLTEQTPDEKPRMINKRLSK